MGGKCGGARQATDDNIIRLMRLMCFVTKAIATSSSGATGYANASQCYIIRTIPLLFSISTDNNQFNSQS